MDSLLSLDESEGELSIGYVDDALLMIAGETRSEVIRKTESQLKKSRILGRWYEVDLLKRQRRKSCV